MFENAQSFTFFFRKTSTPLGFKCNKLKCYNKTCLREGIYCTAFDGGDRWIGATEEAKLKVIAVSKARVITVRPSF